MYSVVLMMALTTGTDAVDFGHRNRCSCAGYGGYYGGGYGCYGGWSGCYGGYGGCYGGYGRSGCSGGYYGGCSGGYYGGCYGGSGCCGGVYGGGVIVGPRTGGQPPETITNPPKKNPSKEEALLPAPTTIIVGLPADAKLTIDGSPTTSTSSTRMLVSPPLERGNTYIYTLRAELNGQAQVQEVRVRPGEITRAQFAFPTAAVAGR